MKAKKYKLKKSVKKILYLSIAIIIAITVLIIVTKDARYKKSDTYKLLTVGYQENEIEVLKDNLSNKQITELVNKEYNSNIVKILKQKYYIEKNYERYIAYQGLNPSVEISDIIALVNVGADHEWYDEEYVVNTDTSKNELMLVNKFHKVNVNYTPNDLETISLVYAYSDNNLRTEVVEYFSKMGKDAKKEGLTLIASSSFRTYEKQDKIYKGNVLNSGQTYADEYSARAGFSEHQTGFATDVLTANTSMSDFDKTAEFEWLSKNSYKYGFILRYPENKSHITGYAYEPWHYRYVGIKVAKEIYEANITFDEYYAYYIEN